jgi:hypothetical protein
VNTSIWITKNHTNYESVTYQSSSSAFVNYTFAPGCDYQTGIQYWKMGSYNNDGSVSNNAYKDTNSSAFQIELRSNMTGNFSAPNGAAYQKGQNVTIVFNVYDGELACGGVPAANSTRIRLYSESGGLEADITSGIVDLGNGTYVYNWSTADATSGDYYNITVTVAKDYYPGGLEIYNNLSFAVGEAPIISGPLLYVGDNWGDEWNFRVTRMDPENDYFNLSLWKRATPESPWEHLETKLIQAQSQDYSYFISEYFDCGDITPSGTFSQFKFNASDQWNFSAETSASPWSA